MDLERAMQAAFDGRAVLFVGAGFSLGATNVSDEPFKSGRQLAQFFAAQTGLSPETPLDDAAEEFASAKGVDTLIALLRREFTAKMIAQHHVDIARVPWRRIYTTNYDDVLETAHKQTSRKLTPIIAADNIRSTPKNDISVHLNGFVDRLDRENLWSQFKLTDTSYASHALDSPWLALFRQDLANATAVFFVGYSIADLDIKRVLFDTPDLRARTFFVLGNPTDSVTKRRVTRYGEVLPLDTAAFSTALEAARVAYTPPAARHLIGNSIRPVHAPTIPKVPTDADVLDLLLKGRVDLDAVFAALRGAPPYFLERKASDNVLALVKHKGSTVVVHSELGNGKSLVLNGVAHRVAETGRAVYEIYQRTDDLFREIDAVLSDSPDALIVVDDYSEWLDVAEYLGMHGQPELSYLLAARTTTNDVRIDDLAEQLQRENVLEISVDRLVDTDIAWLDSCFSHYGLWADKTSWSPIRRRKYLSERCGAQFNGILLTLFNSPHIASRFSSVLNAIRERREYHEIVITVLVLSVLQYPATLNSLFDIWGERVGDKNFRSNPAVRELCDVEQGSVILRSSVAARFLLQKIADAAVVVDTLEHVARVSDRNAGIPFYDGLIRSLMRFADLQAVLPESNRRTNVIRYYESIKNLGAAQRNPHFWLQYAIAAMVIDDYDRAGPYFETAYALSAARDRHDPYMIDNHFARYLLVRAKTKKDLDEGLELFRRARQIIQNQITRERFHYPFRVASGYVDFFDAFEVKLSAEHKLEIGAAAAFVAQRIKKLPEFRQRQKYVKRCAEHMAELLRRSGTPL